MITKKQKQILDILKDNASITLDEIATKLRLSSVSNIHVHIKNLESSGYIKRNGRKIIIKNDTDSVLTYIPYYGTAQCGYNDIFIEENAIDYVPMPSKFLPYNKKDLLLVKAVGDSMEPLISEDELILFEKQGLDYKPLANDIILCYLNGTFKIKKFKILQEKGFLVSENKEMFEPIQVDETDDISLVGKMIKMKF